MIGHKWQPITPLERSCGYDFTELDSLQRQWLSIRQRWEESNPDAYKAFLELLERSWAIETGIIEGIYNIDKGLTQTLVENGLVADLIDRGSTNRDPQELVKVLKDHQDAAKGVYLEIREGKPITRSAIRQMHSVLTRNQPTYRAVNQFGHFFDAALQHGEFKKLPNNPTRADGGIHEYCPPEHVDSELDNLLEIYGQYQQDTISYHPIAVGAWLHHRVTQIHPFQDGNGRVVRTLLTWHLVRENFLPVVVSRDDREKYIDTLEAADAGDLIPFVDLLVQLEKRTILKALGEVVPVGEPASLVEPNPVAASGSADQVLDQLVDRIAGRIRQLNQTQELLRNWQSVSDVARTLRDHATNYLVAQADRIQQRFDDGGIPLEYAPVEPEQILYRQEIEKTAKKAGYQVNFTAPGDVASLSLTPQGRIWIPSLTFVISLHHVGQQPSGVMVATAFAIVYRPRTARIDAQEDFCDCTIRPFTLTWNDDPETLAPRFAAWMEEPLAIALRYWSQFIP